MLLRSASTPLLNSASSWVSNPVAAASPCDQLFSVTTHRPSSPSISHCSLLTSSAPLSSSSASSHPRTVLARAQSEGDLSKFQLAEVPRRRSCLFSNSGLLPSISLEEDAEMELEKDPLAPRSNPVLQRRVLTNSGLDAGAIMMKLAEGSLMENGYCAAVSDEDESEPPAAGTTRGRDSIQLVNDGCAGGGGRGGKMCGGGRGADDKDEEGFGLSDGSDNNCADGVDAYYVRMVKADPRNPLVLGNYAKFLKEVLGDLDKAQVYCERAILAGGGVGVDAGVLSMYADIIWQTSRDADRADTYFNQALQAAPDDCYVAASYAHFLWDAEEEAPEEEETETGHRHHLCHPSSALTQQGRTPTPPIAAPS